VPRRESILEFPVCYGNPSDVPAASSSLSFVYRKRESIKEKETMAVVGNVTTQRDVYWVLSTVFFDI
jgi:hypothetical protein